MRNGKELITEKDEKRRRRIRNEGVRGTEEKDE